MVDEPNKVCVTDITYLKVFYNRTRRHSDLGSINPEAFERAWA